ncbi:4-phosphopantoate--beta-alanine ligase [Sulfodiicoccus acidiphilus]|uniref:4-phosphopantoate--beta-alanine ligase n=1 Tax=Sulfodiicoccus acidiphilus TaxID=1670455 RepID=UPI001664B562|nr:4-phosphopantoate--beta-alanine ligase [Sulfodiicoccus acidiphilus]
MIPSSHPRRESLLIREKLVEAMRSGVLAPEGLIAHGRGECFDYLLGEATQDFARRAVEAAVALLLTAKRPVISVNGNVAALVPEHVVRLSEVAGARIEVNLFYRTPEREKAVAEVLRRAGAREVLGAGDTDETIPELFSERRRVNKEGIFSADVVLLALEDGDRTEALVRMGKKVVSVDLNPLSRTAVTSTVTVVDNVVRAFPAMVEAARNMKGRTDLEQVLKSYNNTSVLHEALRFISQRLLELAQ